MNKTPFRKTFAWSGQRPDLHMEPRPLPAPEISDAMIPIEQRKTIFDLGPKDCRWVVGDVPGDYFYCGGDADLNEGRPYCSTHSRRAYHK
jgi:hypothetical protein